MSRIFYVRPDTFEGYGKGDGSSYENAWNGFKSVNWQTLAGQPATLWVCGEPGGPGGFVTLHVEWSYLQASNAMHRPEESVVPESVSPEAKARINSRRESPVAV
jgi:hypothetical protein